MNFRRHIIRGVDHWGNLANSLFASACDNRCVFLVTSNHNNSKNHYNNCGDQCHRFDLRFLRPLRADLSIRKSSSFFLPLIAATSQRGFAPRPAQVSPEGPRYFGGTFLPFNALPPLPPRLPATAMALFILSNCFSISARRSKSIWSTRFRRSISASTLISDRFTFGMVISGEKTE